VRTFASGDELAGERHQHRVMAPVIVVDDVLVAERDAEDAPARLTPGRAYRSATSLRPIGRIRSCHEAAGAPGAWLYMSHARHRRAGSAGSGLAIEPTGADNGATPCRSERETEVAVHRIAAIPGDGIGQEVIAAGLEVLGALQARAPDLRLEFEAFDWGSDHFRRHGRMMPQDGLDRLRPFEAIYFGAVGAPDIPDDVTLWGLRLAICQGFDQYANVRPARLLPGVTSPLRGIEAGDLDWIVVRENTEGEYAGAGGRVHRGLPEEVGTELAVFTRAGCARIMRFAFELARSRPKRQLTMVTKSNAQRHGMVLWDETFAEVAREFPEVTTDKELVDAMTTRMIFKPTTLDVIVATNLHADILSDLASALSGSLGLGPTANLDPERRFPSMFEPIHGSAFDITGLGIANPIASFWSAVLMLEHLGEQDAAGRLMDAIERTLAAGAALTPDLGGTATTAEVTARVCELLSGANL
jgi:tartrate dehydrogenase/decarboxylase / D-malate dehydrogenase